MMKCRDYSEFFSRATRFDMPYRYQVALAEAEPDQFPSLLSVETGLGKTAAVILAWLWRRRFHSNEKVRQTTPRRLVYCLPMRVLVEQTRACAAIWLDRLGLLEGRATIERTETGSERLVDYGAWDADAGSPDGIRVHLLMGGDVERDWDRYPERDAILIGTQDMLLSRALNRGYAMSRFRWPVQFGLINNDCLWVMDEVQLMGDGLATTAQLQAFRERIGTASPVSSLWMSATMSKDWIATVDYRAGADTARTLRINDSDKRLPILQKRFGAPKKLECAGFEASDDGKDEATLAMGKHKPRTRTLIIVNTVKRAQAVYASLKKQKPTAELVLLHSRFRPGDRQKQLERLLAEPNDHGTIAVCTQVVEAGVDVSARVLIADLAPWASLVQRFGRCNRKGEFSDACVFWIRPKDLDDDKKVKSSPYTPEALRASARNLKELTDVGSSSLPPVTDGMSFTHVLRRRDMMELFDTTPDLAGADVDVSRFIRETDDHDVQVFWREIPKNEDPSSEQPQPAREEMCGVSIGDMGKKRGIWRWDHLGQRWVRPQVMYPGLVLMLRTEDGGYTPELGWTGKGKHTAPIPPGIPCPEGDGSDRDAEDRNWATIAEHSDEVVEQVSGLLAAVTPSADPWRADVLTAARWHDAGKSHDIYRGAIPGGAPREDMWAKSKPRMKRYGRPGFRHELASAIAMLLSGLPEVAAYLVAAHHGKVRLSIRSLPHEIHPPHLDRRFARGVWEGDELPAVDLGGGVIMPHTTLTLSYMELGEDPLTGPSWLARMLALRDSPEVGPFRLAFLEALLRAADWRASEK